MALVIAAIMVISVLSVAFTPVVSEENTSDNITDSDLIEIRNETVANESLVVESNLTEVNETAIEEQHEKFINPYYEEWKKQYEPPFGHPESAEEMNKWIKERRMPQMPKRINISQIREMSYGKGTYLNITGNYSELWSETHDVNDTYAYVVSDMDGDDTEDIIVEMYKQDSVTDEYTYKVIAKKGSDGTELWSESMTSDREGYLHAYSAGDLDGDDLNDVLLRSYNYTGYPDYDYEYKVIAKKGSNGTELWSESMTTGYGGYLDAYPAGDLDGNDLNDVLVESYNYTGYPDYDYEYKVIAKKRKQWNRAME